jgi:CubicO group peptidase (beta-lactamase class C family)
MLAQWNVRRSAFVVAIYVLVLGPIGACAQSQPDHSPEAFGHALKEWADKNNVTKAVVLVRRKGQMVYKHSTGGADPNAPYHLFSLSKAITGACIATLVRDGKLTFKTPLSVGLARFFEETGKPGDPRIPTITIEQLLTHRAGFVGNPDNNDAVTGTNLRAYLDTWSAKEPPRSALLARAFQTKLLRDPGGEFVYGNTAYLALGAVIEEATGLPYESYCRSAVLDPIEVGGDLEPTWRVLSSFGGWRIYLTFLDYFDPADSRLGVRAKAWSNLDALGMGSSSGAWYALGTNVRKYGAGVNVWHWGSWRYNLSKSKAGPLQSSGVTFAARWYDGTGWFVAASPYVPQGMPRRELDRALARSISDSEMEKLSAPRDGRKVSRSRSSVCNPDALRTCREHTPICRV